MRFFGFVAHARVISRGSAADASEAERIDGVRLLARRGGAVMKAVDMSVRVRHEYHSKTPAWPHTHEHGGGACEGERTSTAGRSGSRVQQGRKRVHTLVHRVELDDRLKRGGIRIAAYLNWVFENQDQNGAEARSACKPARRK